MPLTFCVAVRGSSEEPASVLGVSDVQLYQVLLLQVQQVLHCLVAVKQQGGGVLLQQQQQQRVAFIKSALTMGKNPPGVGFHSPLIKFQIVCGTTCLQVLVSNQRRQRPDDVWSLTSIRL